MKFKRVTSIGGKGLGSRVCSNYTLIQQKEREYRFIARMEKKQQNKEKEFSWKRTSPVSKIIKQRGKPRPTPAVKATALAWAFMAVLMSFSLLSISWTCQLSCILGKKWKCQLFSRVQLFVTPWTVAHQAPLSMAFPSRDTGVGSCDPLQGIFPNPGMESASPTLQADPLLSEPSENHLYATVIHEDDLRTNSLHYQYWPKTTVGPATWGSNKNTTN